MLYGRMVFINMEMKLNMSIFTIETIEHYIREIESIKLILTDQSDVSPSEKFGQYENRLTIEQIESCLLSYSGDELNESLRELLSTRWERIRNSYNSYTQSPHTLVNTLCLDLAKKLSPLPEDADVIDELGPRVGPYFLLMPSLTASKDIYGSNIHHLRLHQFILSDDGHLFIPIEACLYLASLSDEGELRHQVSESDVYPTLSMAEVERISGHSTQVTAYYNAIEKYNAKRLRGEDLGPQLHRLKRALLDGGVLAEGEELDSGSAANTGIAEFYAYWESLTPGTQQEYYDRYSHLQETLGRLFRPTDTDYLDTRYCVQLLANRIEAIVQQNGIETQSLVTLKDIMDQKKQQLSTAFCCDDYQVNPSFIKPTYDVLTEIFKLPAVVQKEIFSMDGCENAWMYALEHEPSALIGFAELLDETAIQAAIYSRFNHGNTALTIAVQSGSYEAVNMLLQLGASIDACDSLENNTALMWATIGNRLDLVNLLLEGDAWTESKNNTGTTALHLAIHHGHRAILDALLERHASLITRANDGKNALEIAQQMRPEFLLPILFKAVSLNCFEQAALLSQIPPKGDYKNVLEYVLQQHTQHFIPLLRSLHTFGTTLSKPIVDCTMLASIAARNGHVAELAELHALGADLTALTKEGETLAYIAAKHEQITVLLELNRLGVDVDRPNVNGETPAHLAARNGLVEVLKNLQGLGVSLNTPTADGRTLIYLAAESGQVAALIALHHLGADLDVPRDNGATPAMAAAITGHFSVLRELHGFGVDLKMPFANGITLARIAAEMGHVAVITELWNCGVDLKALQPDGTTLAHHAAGSDKAAVLAELHRLGIELSTPNQEGVTPVFIAVKNGSIAALKELKRHDVDFRAPMPDGTTLAHFAAQNGQAPVLPELHSLGLDLTVTNMNGVTPVHLAAQLGHVAVITALHQLDIDVDTPDINGATPAGIAAQYGQVAVLHELFRLKATLINKPMKNGATLAFIAAQSGQLGVIEFLMYSGANMHVSFLSPKTLLIESCADKPADIGKRIASKVEESITLWGEDADVSLLPIDIAWIMGHQAIVDCLLRLPMRLRGVETMSSAPCITSPLTQHGFFSEGYFPLYTLEPSVGFVAGDEGVKRRRT